MIFRGTVPRNRQGKEIGAPWGGHWGQRTSPNCPVISVSSQVQGKFPIPGLRSVQILFKCRLIMLKVIRTIKPDVGKSALLCIVDLTEHKEPSAEPAAGHSLASLSGFQRDSARWKTS